MLPSVLSVSTPSPTLVPVLMPVPLWTVIGPTLFSVLLWGAILAVAIVFAYEAYAVAREFVGR